jgi:hypothetical protein
MIRMQSYRWGRVRNRCKRFAWYAIAHVLLFLVAPIVCRASIPAFAHGSEEHAAIVRVLKSEFDRPESPLAVAPVVVVEDHAIAGWVQDKRGGRALMRKVGGKWTIHLCSGDPLKNADMLESTGIPAGIAKTLSDRLAAAERAMPAETLALFATFEGVVHIGADGHHPPPGHGHHPPGAHDQHHQKHK